MLTYDRLGQVAHKAASDLMVRRVSKEVWGLPGPKELRASRESKGLRDQRVLKGPKGVLGLQDLKGHREFRAALDQQVLKDFRGYRVA